MNQKTVGNKRLLNYSHLCTKSDVRSVESNIFGKEVVLTSCYDTRYKRSICRCNQTKQKKAELTIAPKLCPISCHMTCHSTRPAVETAVPETIEGELPDDVC